MPVSSFIYTYLCTTIPLLFKKIKPSSSLRIPEAKKITDRCKKEFSNRSRAPNEDVAATSRNSYPKSKKP